MRVDSDFSLPFRWLVAPDRSYRMTLGQGDTPDAIRLDVFLAWAIVTSRPLSSECPVPQGKQENEVQINLFSPKTLEGVAQPVEQRTFNP